MLFPSIFLEYLEEKIDQSEFYKPELCEMSAEYKIFGHFCLQFQKPHHTAVNKCSHRDSAPHSIRLPCRKHSVCAGSVCNLPLADTPGWEEILFLAGPFVRPSSDICAR